MAELVLDQRVVSGIGNIYKSEGLFLAAIDPHLLASRVSFDDTATFFAEVIPLMQAGRLRFGMIETLPEELRYEPWMRTWVYRRRGQPRFVRGSPIQMVRQGDLQRTTYFCAHCQYSADADQEKR